MILIKSREMRVITCMIMLTRFSERNFNLMRYTGLYILHINSEVKIGMQYTYSEIYIFIHVYIYTYIFELKFVQKHNCLLFMFETHTPITAQAVVTHVRLLQKFQNCYSDKYIYEYIVIFIENSAGIIIVQC